MGEKLYWGKKEEKSWVLWWKNDPEGKQEENFKIFVEKENLILRWKNDKDWGNWLEKKRRKMILRGKWWWKKIDLEEKNWFWGRKKSNLKKKMDFEVKTDFEDQINYFRKKTDKHLGQKLYRRRKRKKIWGVLWRKRIILRENMTLVKYLFWGRKNDFEEKIHLIRKNVRRIQDKNWTIEKMRKLRVSWRRNYFEGKLILRMK